MVIYSHAVVTVTSECYVKRIVCNTWTGTLANSADPDQTPQNEPSDYGLYCLPKAQEVEGLIFIPVHMIVAGYYGITLAVRMSVRLSVHLKTSVLADTKYIVRLAFILALWS